MSCVCFQMSFSSYSFYITLQYIPKKKTTYKHSFDKPHSIYIQNIKFRISFSHQGQCQDQSKTHLHIGTCITQNKQTDSTKKKFNKMRRTKIDNIDRIIEVVVIVAFHLQPSRADQ